MKKIISVLLVVIILCIGLASCGNDADAASVDTTYISMRINPEIEMVADDDGIIVYASAINDDGEVVLSSINLEGMTIEEAGVEFTEAADEMGYVNEDDATVYIDVQGTSETESEAVRQRLNKDIGKYFNNKGINGKVSRETLDRYLQSAENWGLSVGHTKLVMRVLDAHPELTEDEVLSMKVSEWMTLLNGNKGNTSAAKELKKAHRENLESIKAEFERLFELRAQIEELSEQLKDEGLTTDERAEIEAELSSCEVEANALKSEYKSALAEARKSHKEELKELKKAEKKQAK